MPEKLTEDNFSEVIYSIVKKYENEPKKCFEKLMELKYPNSNEYIQLEHAKCFYEKFMKFTINIKMDKDFTKNAYDFNSKIFKDTHVKK
jgi:hypothetical protein